MAVGAPGDRLETAGELHLFEELEVWAAVGALSGQDSVPGDRHAASTALDGHWAVVGSPDHEGPGGAESGASYLFSRSPGEIWSQEAKVVPSQSSAGQRFGEAVAIAGDLAVVGAPGEDSSGAGSGAAYVFRADPVARFSASPRNGPSPLEVTFSDESLGDIVTRAWDFDGDGMVDLSTTATSVSHTYADGSHTVCLTVSGGQGSDTECRPHYISVAAPPVADFSAAPTSGVAPLSVTFSDLSTGEVDERRWSFDFDSDPSFDLVTTEPTVTHTYTGPGTFSVRLQVEGPGGQGEVVRANYITVDAPPAVPVIQNGGFEANGSVIQGASGRVDQGNPIAVWQVTDPARAGRNTQGYPYYNNGVNPEGDVVAFIKMLTSLKQTVADFQAGKTYRLSLGVNARAGFPTPTLQLTLGGSVELVQAIPALEGDGSHTQPFTTVAVDVSPGSGSHELVISQVAGGDAGLVIDDVHIVELPPVPPTASFTGTPLVGAAPLQVTFTDTSSGDVTVRRWDFDNDGIFEVPNGSGQESHVYTAPGIYSVRLEVEGPGGQDSSIRTGYITVTDPSQVPVIQNGGFEANGSVIQGASGRVDQGNPIAVWQVTDPARAGRNTQGYPY
ncbi:MAG: PKD domain-containing protein, partial [Holophagales bacterium]|nr:PKD domain-containing protein [Holophagales bacterium]